MNDEDEFERFGEDETDDGDGADDTAELSCPYCGETIEVAVDRGGGAVQQYIEDCQVCCRPMRLMVRFGRDGSASVDASAEDEADAEE
jgi:hypothetical protein